MTSEVACEMARIEDWMVAADQVNKDLPPEARIPCLSGKVFGDPRFKNGTEIITSAIVSAEEKDGVVIVTTRKDGQYKLGAVNPEYERRFPDAKQRFLDTWSKNN